MRYDCQARYTLDQLTAQGRAAAHKAQPAINAFTPAYVWDCKAGGWIANPNFR